MDGLQLNVQHIKFNNVNIMVIISAFFINLSVYEAARSVQIPHSNVVSPSLFLVEHFFVFLIQTGTL